VSFYTVAFSAFKSPKGFLQKRQRFCRAAACETAGAGVLDVAAMAGVWLGSVAAQPRAGSS
jgi:hypothetical protein